MVQTLTAPAMSNLTYRQPKTPFILVPLYIYPLRKGETWAPLFEAVRRYPDLSYVVIVNPDSGPGQGLAPDENYLAVLSILVGCKNVTILGYVAVCWAEREFDEVTRDVRAYYHWERITHHKHDYDDSSNLRIDGIFFDEAPSKATEENVTYMSTAAKLARSLARSPDRPWNSNRTYRAEQITKTGHSTNDTTSPDHHRSREHAEHNRHQSQPSSSSCTIIYNPGTPPSHSSPFFDSSTQADYIVVLEQTLATWPRPQRTPELSNPRFESDTDPDPVLGPEDVDPVDSENRKGRDYIASCLASLSPEERARSIAITHSVASLEDQLRFVAEAVEYSLAGHFATSSGDYSSWSGPPPSEKHEDCLESESNMSLSPDGGSLEEEGVVNVKTTGNPSSHWMRYVEEADRLASLTAKYKSR